MFGFTPSGPRNEPAAGTVLHGVPVVAGVGYAPVIRPGRRPLLDDVDSLPAVDETDRAGEATRFAAAVAAVAQRLRDRAAHATGAVSELLAATAALAQDRALLNAAKERISAGVPAVRATALAVEQFAEVFTRIGGPTAERVADLHDIRDRVIAQLSGFPEPGVPRPGRPSILCADDLTPVDTAGLDPRLVVGLATSLGGPTSHTSIIARQLGIPCVVAVAGLDDVAPGTLVLVDGAGGTVTVAPDPAAARDVVHHARSAETSAVWRGPGATADGHPVAVLANVHDGATARAARETPAEGVGLFRTELCFLNRDTEPGLDEQAAIYAEVLQAFSGRRVVVRTLDAGSDKPLRFVSHRDEANPALGVRGIRIAVSDPGLLERQLRAIAAAAAATCSSPWVMAPMIATAEEAMVFAARARSYGLTPGVVIEVPAAAVLADRILEHVEFLSIGTNDLAQYTMAADRTSPGLAPLADPWQPAVLALVAATAGAGARAAKPVGVCGEAAADPLLGCVLVGLGITSLSAAPAAVGPVGAKLASVTLQQCRDAAEAVLATATPGEARARALRHLG